MREDEAFDGSPSMTRKQVLVRGGGVALSLSALLSACGGSSSPGGSSGSGGGAAAKGLGAGIAATKLSEFQPFQFSSAAGAKPSLPKRLALANVNKAQIYTLMSQGMQKACHDRGLDFAEANAQDNVGKNVSQIQAFLQRGTGGLTLIPTGEGTQTAVTRQALKEGTVVFGLVNAPCTSQLVADQYKVGKAHGEAAAAWIRANLDGKAKVAYFNLDALTPALIPRHKGVLDALEAVGSGVKIIDRGVGAKDFSADGGFKFTSSLLQAHPDVDVIMGADTFILGSAKAVKAAGNAKVKYISGVDGEDLVLDEIEKGGLIKATQGFAWPIFGYAQGQFAADWLEGKTIPQVIIVEPIRLDSAAAIEEFKTKNADPAKYWKTDYVSFLGSISYEKRQNWLQKVLSGQTTG
jgi:ribose transport system substrate-binding protein